MRPFLCLQQFDNFSKFAPFLTYSPFVDRISGSFCLACVDSKTFALFEQLVSRNCVWT